jgi:competence protein ComEA
MSATARLLYGIPLDVNRASARELEMLPGLGPKLAAAIVAERENGGPFANVMALVRVRGIGPATAYGLQPYLAVP